MAVCPDCGHRFDARTAERNRAPVYTDRRCEWCGEIFDTTERSRARHCSRTCQVAAYRDRTARSASTQVPRP